MLVPVLVPALWVRVGEGGCGWGWKILVGTDVSPSNRSGGKGAGNTPQRRRFLPPFHRYRDLWGYGGGVRCAGVSQPSHRPWIIILILCQVTNTLFEECGTGRACFRNRA